MKEYTWFMFKSFAQRVTLEHPSTEGIMFLINFMRVLIDAG